MFSTKNALVSALAVVAVSGALTQPASAAPIYSGYAGHGHPSAVKRFFYEHPKVKSATIGAGVGTAAGALTGLVAGRSVMKGALVGAGAGAGVGLIRSSYFMQRHPIAKNTLTGTVVGLGLGSAASHHGSAMKGAAVGTIAGLGFGVLSNVLR